jgi:hypothetical protein
MKLLYYTPFKPTIALSPRQPKVMADGHKVFDKKVLLRYSLEWRLAERRMFLQKGINMNAPSVLPLESLWSGRFHG